MSFEVEVISEEIIKPSSPTPDNLRRYTFSFLDQIAPPVYNPLLLFYESNGRGGDTTQISNHLKNSLAQVLTLYYPLAGRIRAKRFVDCNDEGVPFVEARVLHCTLSNILSNPIPAELNKLLPFELDDHVNNEFPLGVQLNIFPCGGIAIGQCLTHKMADGLSYFTFSKIWAAISRGESRANIKPPQFVSAALFPPKEFHLGFDASVGITKDRVTKRFVFSASTLETLGAKYEEKMKITDQLKSPTRVESLLAFITSRVAAATTKDCKLYRVLQAVNLRPKFDPPLPQESFGNLFRIALTSPLQIKDEDEEGDDGVVVIREVRGELSKIDNGYVKKLQKQGDEHLCMIKKHADDFKRVETAARIISFSSYCRFPLYDNDFGWGKPVWVGSPALTYKNLVLFMDPKEGDGIEAYVSLEENVMARFECDRELLSCVSPTGPGLNSKNN